MLKTAAWLAWALEQETDTCLLWPFSRGSHGYGDFRRTDGHHTVHVYICEQTHGPRPTPRHDASHSCNTPLCANKRHLRWDTRKGNFWDKRANGTHPARENSPQAILTEVQVAEIRAVPNFRGIGPTLGKKYGVHFNTIYAVREGRSWPPQP